MEDLCGRFRAQGGQADALELDAFIHYIPHLNGREFEMLVLILSEHLPVGSKARDPRKDGPADHRRPNPLL